MTPIMTIRANSRLANGPAVITATDRKIQPGQIVVMTSIGGGYLYGAVAFVT